MQCGRKNTPRTSNLFGEFAVGGTSTLNRQKVKSLLPSKYEPQQTRKQDNFSGSYCQNSDVRNRDRRRCEHRRRARGHGDHISHWD